jgi:hypothetical protein
VHHSSKFFKRNFPISVGIHLLNNSLNDALF